MTNDEAGRGAAISRPAAPRPARSGVRLTAPFSGGQPPRGYIRARSGTLLGTAVAGADPARARGDRARRDYRGLDPDKRGDPEAARRLAGVVGRRDLARRLGRAVERRPARTAR